MPKYDIIIIGAGASGLMAAGCFANTNYEVLVLEKMPVAGKKLLITGKGRCNITNTAPMYQHIEHCNSDGKFLRTAFADFSNQDLIKYLNNNGLNIKIEQGGRVFPASDKSADVLNTLLKISEAENISFKYNSKVEDIFYDNANHCYNINYNSQNSIKTISSEYLLLCTGGKSYPATGSTGDGYKFAEKLGHKINHPMQALVPICCQGDIHKQLQGISLKNVKLILWIDGKKIKDGFGELIFTHFGLSGPIILKLSRYIVIAYNKKQNIELSIDFKPALDENFLDEKLIRELNTNSKKKIFNIARNWLPTKIISVFFNISGIDKNKESNQITANERKKMRNFLKDFRLTVNGIRSFKEAIITAGGVSLSEIEKKNYAI